MRAFWTVVHRWVGLITAGFLFLTGITGAVISWDHELDDWLNPHLVEAHTQGSAQSPLLLAEQIEARYPEIAVRSLPLFVEEGESLVFGVAPRVDPVTKKLFEPGFNQVFVDPVSGEELGKREWGAVWPLSKETFVSFLYKLHYTLHLPEMWGIDRWGIWLLGIIAILWTFDCFVGAYLTLPARKRSQLKAGDRQASDDALADDMVIVSKSFWQRWQPAWKIRMGAGPYKLNFDLHRAVSLWTWGILFIVAFTAFSLNLFREVFHPMMNTFSQVTPTPFDQRERTPKHEPVTPELSFAEVIAIARADAQARGWEEPAGSVFYAQNFGIYGVQFFHPEADHGVGGVGHKRLYYDAVDGRYLGDRQPWKGTAADIFIQAQFPLHSGRILGLPGRILISVLGLVVAMLSVTGVYIWWKKRIARSKQLARADPAATRRVELLFSAQRRD
ncbi:PepSY-associated TM helix domain-containing protein [Nitrosomonas nitrosa]|uniref:PepSY-associated TM helix domain-containing protein n=1 Tax=Nitrosomonas nitrosa TaxID=52442 RepID=UPI0023F8809B|nr:PepSY-associated TM helix domain-containing protein [Nitrosomonas nitrosa]MCO6432951.1 PepSY domain-containing protein [Nitrosomonas nitrosa]